MQELLEYSKMNAASKKSKNYFFLFLAMEAALPCSIKLNSKVTMIFMFSTPGPSEKNKAPLKKQLAYSIASIKVLNSSNSSFKEVFS